jgi:hypothetical protein
MEEADRPLVSLVLVTPGSWAEGVTEIRAPAAGTDSGEHYMMVRKTLQQNVSPYKSCGI